MNSYQCITMSKDNHRRDIDVKYYHKYLIYILKTHKSHKYRIFTHTYNTTSLKKAKEKMIYQIPYMKSVTF